MKISIIVPAFNEEKLLPATLDSINAALPGFHAAGCETEIIVCDNNSTDRTADAARAGGAKVVFEPLNQIARARNTGASVATGDWLVFVDADSSPSRELFADVAAEIAKGKCVGGGSIIHMDIKAHFGLVLYHLWNWISRIRRWMAGSFIFCEALAFRELGGFSKELYASEEIEFSQRLKALARRRKKKVVILHRHPLTTSARKLDLYTFKEMMAFFGRLAVGGKRTLRQKEACHFWYDGRR